MILVTGDTHSEVKRRFKETAFFGGSNYRVENVLTSRNDYLIICGDFGIIWDYGGESYEETQELNYLEKMPFTILFVDGNHENFDRLNAYPIEMWNSGKIHRIRENIIHLMRGQVFDLPFGEGYKRVFTFGGARSHNISDGILDPEKDREKIKQWDRHNLHVQYNYFGDGGKYKYFRVLNQTWWSDEMPNELEYQEGIENLDKVNWNVDYIITHDCGSTVRDMLGYTKVEDKNELTSYLNMIYNNCQYKFWYFGHLHNDIWVTEKDCLLYHKVIPVDITGADSMIDLFD